MPRWEVETTACIGFFSFTKYLMWLDLAARDDLLQSPVLQHLVERPGTTFAQDAPEFARERLDEHDRARCSARRTPTARSSPRCSRRRGALVRARRATGHRQVADDHQPDRAGARDGQRVLFVAEKRAALEVVQRRLAEVGLGPFCLELHSSKSGPKAVLEQLRRALEVGQRREPAEWQQIAVDLQQQRDQLNAYVEAMHRRREHGISVFGAIGKLVTLRDSKRLPMPELMRGSPADVVAARGAVDDLAAASAVLGVPAQEPWWGVQRVEWTPALARDVVPLAQRLQRATSEMQAQVERFAQAVGLAAVFGEVGPSRDQFGKLFELAALFQAPSLPPAAMLRVADWSAAEASLGQLVAIGTKRDSLWEPLQARWRSDLLGLDLDRLAASYRRSADAFFVVRWWRLRKPRRELLAVAANGQVGTATEVRSDLERALQVRAEDQRLAAGAAGAQVLGAAWRDGHADWAEVQRWLQWVREARRLCLQLVPGSLHADPAVLAAIAAQLDGQHGGAEVLSKLLGALRLANDEFGAVMRAAATMLELDEDQAFGLAAAPGYLGRVARRTAGWLAAVPRLREHCAYRRAASAAATHGAEPLVEAHAHGDLRTDELAGTFQRTFLESWLDSVHAREPLLAMFRGQEHERVIARFGELDRRAIKMAADVVVARLCANLPQVRDTQVASSELGVLERELKKQRRTSRCASCSPRSLACYAPRSVHADEPVVGGAVSRARGHPLRPRRLRRGVADSDVGRGRRDRARPFAGGGRRQPAAAADDVLPAPGARTTRSVQDDMPEDLESVLDECGAAGLPRMHLDWHYRSRHESLIAFSNHHYYQNRLLTFPAPQHRAPGLGVRCVQVPGVYDRAGSQQNPHRSRGARGRGRGAAARPRAPAAIPRHRDVQPGAAGADRRPARPGAPRTAGDRGRLLRRCSRAGVREEPRERAGRRTRHDPVLDLLRARRAGKVHENYGPLNRRAANGASTSR
jgi:hypothetical protein